MPDNHREYHHILDCESCQVTYRSLMNRVDRSHRQGNPTVSHIQARDMFLLMNEHERQDLFLAIEHDTRTFLQSYNFELGVSTMNLWTRDHKQMLTGNTYRDNVEEWTALPMHVRQEYAEKRNNMKLSWLKSTESLTSFDLTRLFDMFPHVKRQIMHHLRTRNHKTSPFHRFISVNHINVRDAAKLWQQLSPEEQKKYEKYESNSDAMSAKVETGEENEDDGMDDSEGNEKEGEEQEQDQGSSKVKRVKV